jgi:hypothetical protein
VRREDYNLIASLLFSAINEFEAEPKIALRFAAALARKEGQAFQVQDFVNRCVPTRRREEVGKIHAKRPLPEKEVKTVQTEDDAALFTAILGTEFPHLKESLHCALTLKQSARFSIGRVGSRVWIRFGGQAMQDPVGAVRAAVPDAEAMLRGQVSAREIVSRTA